MDSGGMDMSGMSMGSGIPSSPYLQQVYWAVVGTVIGIATVANVQNWILNRQRLSAADKGLAAPAKPESRFWRFYATIIAISREVAYASFTPIHNKRFTLRFPRFGRTALILGNLIVLLVLCFYNLDGSDSARYEAIGYRTGFINLCQLPLLFLLVGKNNVITVLTGFSFEKLNWIHRWVARCLLITVTLHMGYWFANWAPYDHYISIKIATDDITRYGMIAWAILLWIVFSSFAPIRGWYYEFFVIQHIVSFSAFLAIVWLHIPAGASSPRYWVYICIALVSFDRLVRILRVLWINLSLFRPGKCQNGQKASLLSCQAEFTPMGHDTTRITIKDPPISWKPGQFVFFSCHSLVPLQSHPFTIASIPEDGKLECLVKSNKGATRSFFRHATKKGQLPSSTEDAIVAKGEFSIIEGPYGNSRPLRQFDSIVLFAGGTGATFTMPLMRDLVASWKAAWKDRQRSRSSTPNHKESVTRYIHFVWVVKSRTQLDWFPNQLTQTICDVQELKDTGADVVVNISVYVTCDNTFTTGHKDVVESLLQSSNNKHGIVEDISTVVEKEDEKAFGKVEEREVEEIRADQVSESVEVRKGDRGPDGTCSCQRTVDHEDATSSIICTCNASKSQTPSIVEASSITSSASSDDGHAKKPWPLHPDIFVFGGRPHPRSIIRDTLEQAYGESAVVVCGPTGLVDDVRLSTISLSNGRAVHKGTGAQGICLITEHFGY